MDDQPSMQQDWHPDHNMPDPEYNGAMLAHTKARDMLEDRNRTAEFEGIARNGDTISWKGPK